jgi:RND family efflux transporter MFP subunit
VIARNYEPGENVSPNATLLKIVDPEKMEIQSNVPESDIVKVEIGQPAKVAFDALPSDEILQAKVTEVDPASTVIQDVVYYRVKFKLDNFDSRLKIGMSEDVDILTASKENALMIPLRAVKTEGTDKYVEILKDEINNITSKIEITTGLEGDDGMTEVVSGNLSVGDKVITLVSNGK